MHNPLEPPTHLTATVTTAINTNQCIASTSNVVAPNAIMAPHNLINSNNAQQQNQTQSNPLSYTTQSLTTPMKGIIPKLQHEETKGIPIPGRAQSHDDIRMLGTGSAYGSPNSNYGISPNSPRSQYFYGSSPNSSGLNASPPINYGSYTTTGGMNIARRALSRAASPLSSSVPNNSLSASNLPKSGFSSNSRYIAVSKHCSRSEPKCVYISYTEKQIYPNTHTQTQKTHTHTKHIQKIQSLDKNDRFFM